jgi:hypothetical protein
MCVYNTTAREANEKVCTHAIIVATLRIRKNIRTTQTQMRFEGQKKMLIISTISKTRYSQNNQMDCWKMENDFGSKDLPE